MSRYRADLDGLDADSLFGRDEAAQRAAEKAERRALAAERMEQEATREAAAAARAKEFTIETSRLMILAEYRAAGLDPPPGTPRSLALLRSLGWTVEEFAGAKTLVAPAARERWTGHRDADSLPIEPEETR